MLTNVEEAWARTDDGVRLWTVRSGCGSQPLLLCHGGPGSWDQMDTVADMLDEVAQIVRWDQRGCGRSDGDGPYTYDRFIADLETIRRHWEIGRCLVGGHSAGASLALLYAVAHPDQTGGVIYLSGTGLSWSDRDSNRYRENRAVRLGEHLERWQQLRAVASPTAAERRELMLLDSSTDFGATAPDTLALAETWFDERFEPNMECNASLGRETKEREAWARRHLATIVAPVLVVHGLVDPRPAAGAEELARELPNAKLVVLEDVGHLPWAQHPQRLHQVLHDFVVALG